MSEDTRVLDLPFYMILKMMADKLMEEDVNEKEFEFNFPDFQFKIHVTWSDCK